MDCHFGPRAGAASEWSAAIKSLLRKWQLWTAEHPEAQDGRFGTEAGAAPEWSAAIKSLLWKRPFSSPWPPEAQAGRCGQGAGPASHSVSPTYATTIRQLCDNYATTYATIMRQLRFYTILC